MNTPIPAKWKITLIKVQVIFKSVPDCISLSQVRNGVALRKMGAAGSDAFILEYCSSLFLVVHRTHYTKGSKGWWLLTYLLQCRWMLMYILNIVFLYEWERKQLKYLFWVDQQNNHKISELFLSILGMLVGS